MAEKSAESTSSAASPTLSQEDKSTGNWWDSWLTTAKSKSAEVYSMVKKDLDEIGSAVKSEASHVLSSTSNVIGKTLKLDEPESPANVMKKSFSTFIGQVNTVLNPEPDDEDDTEVILSSGDTTMFSTYKKELEALQRVDATYIVPAESPEFSAWRESLERKGPAVSPASAMRRLRDQPALRAQYDRLVPDAVSHDDFWERYLFRVALLQDRLAAASRKQPVENPTSDPVLAHLPLQEPIEVSPKKVLSGIDDDTTEVQEHVDIDKVVAWEVEDFAHDVELTEEQQTLLLEEYEREISSKKNTKSPRKSTNNNTKSPKSKTEQTRDTMNNRTTIDKENESGMSPSRGVKSDICGNNIVEDYFGDKETKDDASSDESWEKEFEVDEVKQKH